MRHPDPASQRQALPRERRGRPKTIKLSVGRKFDQPIEDAYQLDFAYRVVAATTDYLQVLLSADEGPLSTKNYRIQVEAVPIDAKRSVIHMSYAYGYGFAAKIAMQTYLSTLGSAKVGFTVLDRKPTASRSTRPACSACSSATRCATTWRSTPTCRPTRCRRPSSRKRRIREWYASTERYAAQLHEMEQNEYLDMKRKEMRRQQQG